MTLQTDIRRFWLMKYGRPVKQQGGAVLYVKAHPIKYMEDSTGTNITILAGNNAEYAPCITLTLDQTTAVLQYVKRGPKCFVDGYTDSKDLVLAAYQLAKQRGMQRLEFTDLSYIYCPQEIRLADLSFLTTGKTWYESILPRLKIGYEPYLEEWRKRVVTNTWRQVGYGIIDIDITGIDIDAPGSAMIVLNVLKNSKEYCPFFHTHMSTLIDRSRIHSLHGYSWYIDIKHSSQRVTQRRSRTRRGQ